MRNGVSAIGKSQQWQELKTVDAELSSEPGAAATTTSMDPGEHFFQRGDRVVLSGMQQQPSLNGRHGHVAAFGSQNYAVHLDAGNGKAQFHTVIVPFVYLQHESTENIPLSCAVQDRAAVNNGVLVSAASIGDFSPAHDQMSMIIVMNNLRWLAIKLCESDLSGEPDLLSLIRSKHEISITQVQSLSFQVSNRLNELFIKSWDKIENVGTGCGLYMKFQQLLDSQGITTRFIREALNEVRAIKSWNLGIQDDFWMVGRDAAGSYVVPDRKSHQHVVYKVVGINGPQESTTGDARSIPEQTSPVRLIRVPMLFRMTILPWYGRLIYDTTMRPPAPTNVQMANVPEQAHRLHQVVLHSIHAGTVIEHFAELEK
jgi:hypothetical protein